MSSSDYDKFIIEKYRLAIALAVLKSKPQNISIIDHLNILKTINDENDDDITICESDFDVDENDSNLEHENDVSNDSVTILKNFDFGNSEDISKTNNATLINVMKELNDIDDITNKKGINTNDSQSTYFEGSQESKIDLINDILNEIDADIISEQFTNNTEKETGLVNSPKTIDVNEIDSQQTELYTLRDYIDFNTHISQSQDDFVISTNLYLNNAKSDDLRPNNNQKTENIDENTKTNINLTNQVPNNVTNDVINNTSLVNDTNDRKSKLNDGQIFKTKRIKIDSNISNNNPDDFSTQFSTQSTNSCDTNSKHNKSIDLSLNLDILNTNSTITSNSQSKYPKKLSIQETTTDRNDFDSVIKNTINANAILCNANSFSLNEFEYNTESQIFSLNNSRTNKIDKEIDDQISQNDKTIHERDDIDNDNYLKADNLARSDLINENLSIDRSSNGSSVSDLTDSQAEIVTFKVLEELNKVKNYLNRKLTKSDSGYRSFQPRSSGDSASQCSSLWINESAHCLMDFLTTCPLVISTSEITDEISKVLGKLIDKLHEDEIYPKFLEEILDICNDLLNTIYEGRNYGENILNKDETVQRFLFFNRSLHIIKYSIEKITAILEITLENLNDSFEIQHTDESENICYIFYILEDLLKRNNRYKIFLSQNSSQTSQEDKKVLKKSSLTEIWRKKWNLTKIDICEGTLEKKCSLTKCSDVLNKIIVQAMEGYSLISFAALQCFNLLQN